MRPIARSLMSAAGLVVGIAAIAVSVVLVAGSNPTGSAASGLHSGTPQGWGSAVVVCDLARRESIDPIVSPGSMPSAHEHDFYGNLRVDAASNGERLRTSPTNCDVNADRSAYWLPTMMRDGIPIDPDHLAVYYRTPPGVDQVAALPLGLELVGGGDHDSFGWSCGRASVVGDVPTSCAPDSQLRLHVAFPDCWNGELRWNADAPSAVHAPADAACPEGFDVRLPQIELVVHTGLSGDLGTVRLSSEPQVPAHADVIVGWPPGGLPEPLAGCLRNHVRCTGSQ